MTGQKIGPERGHHRGRSRKHLWGEPWVSPSLKEILVAAGKETYVRKKKGWYVAQW